MTVFRNWFASASSSSGAPADGRTAASPPSNCSPAAAAFFQPSTSWDSAASGPAVDWDRANDFW